MNGNRVEDMELIQNESFIDKECVALTKVGCGLTTPEIYIYIYFS